MQEDSLLHGPIDHIPPSLFDFINEYTVYKMALNTKGAAGPSGVDAELYHRILYSKNLGKTSKELREKIALMTRNLLTSHFYPSILEARAA